MFASLTLLAASSAALTPTALAQACEGKDGWNTPAPPARIHGSTYYVGTCGLTSLLITSPQGHILIDGATPEAAPLIAANIARLGFRLRDVKLILNSHEHFDHAGGIAELQRRTGARVMVLPAARTTFKTGHAPANDPQSGALDNLAPVRVAATLRHGQTVRLGQLALTAHATTGHAPGSTSWTWSSCEGPRCLTVAYGDSISAISAKGYRFTDDPSYVADFRAGMARLAAIRCDLLITPHPSGSRLFERFGGKAPLTDQAACQNYAATGLANLNKRLASEATPTP